MNPTAVDRLVLRALAGADAGMTLAAVHCAVARDPESAAMRAFGAEISAALARLLMSGAVTVTSSGGVVRYLLVETGFGRVAVA